MTHINHLRKQLRSYFLSAEKREELETELELLISQEHRRMAEEFEKLISKSKS